VAINTINLHYYDQKFHFSEISQCWAGWIALNGFCFYYEIKNNDYILFNPEESGEETQQIFQEALKDEKVSATFKQLLTFTHHLEELKQSNMNISIQHLHVIETDLFLQQIVKLKDSPIIFQFLQDKSLKNTVSVEVLINAKQFPLLESLGVVKIVDYLGEKNLRNFWNQIIKDDKERLRLINYSII